MRKKTFEQRPIFDWTMDYFVVRWFTIFLLTENFTNNAIEWLLVKIMNWKTLTSETL